MRHAVELEAFNRAEKSQQESQGILTATTASSADREQKDKQGRNDLQQIKPTIERLEKELEKIAGENTYRYKQPRPVNTKQKTSVRRGKDVLNVGSSSFEVTKLKKLEVAKRKTEVQKLKKTAAKRPPPRNCKFC